MRNERQLILPETIEREDNVIGIFFAKKFRDVRLGGSFIARVTITNSVD
jgi:hypothetical protein